MKRIPKHLFFFKEKCLSWIHGWQIPMIVRIPKETIYVNHEGKYHIIFWEKDYVIDQRHIQKVNKENEQRYI